MNPTVAPHDKYKVGLQSDLGDMQQLVFFFIMANFLKHIISP